MRLIFPYKLIDVTHTNNARVTVTVRRKNIMATSTSYSFYLALFYAKNRWKEAHTIYKNLNMTGPAWYADFGWLKRDETIEVNGTEITVGEWNQNKD